MANKEDLLDYLVKNGLASSSNNCSIEEIHGGIINKVFRIKCNGRSFILKQFLDEAKADNDMNLPAKRGSYEMNAISYLNKVMSEKITPDILFFDEENKVICMQDLGEDNRLDKLILSGDLSIKIFSKIGRILAEIQNRSFYRDSLSRLFDNHGFQDIKIRYRYYKPIDDPTLIGERDKLLGNCEKNNITFIHNDLKLSNFFVLEDDKFCLIDYEGAYHGDPAFEIGYFLAHLLVYYFCNPLLRNRRMILEFWGSYINSLDFKFKQKLEENIVKHAGFIMIYKLVGIAKGDYDFVDQKDKLRIIEIAKRIIRDDRISKVYQLLDV